MAIKPQSIRSGVVVLFDNKIVDKQTVITASETWSPNQNEPEMTVPKTDPLARF
jgi:hypothetical protein